MSRCSIKLCAMWRKACRDARKSDCHTWRASSNDANRAADKASTAFDDVAVGLLELGIDAATEGWLEVVGDWTDDRAFTHGEYCPVKRDELGGAWTGINNDALAVA